MPWVKRLPVEPHVCLLPDIWDTRGRRNFGDGSEWQCDECKTLWIYAPPIDWPGPISWREVASTD